MKKIFAVPLSICLILALIYAGYSFDAWRFAHPGKVYAQQFADCVSSAVAPACSNAATGHVTLAAGATTAVVATAAVANGSEIFLVRNDAEGTLLGVTCNTATTMGDLKTSARTPGTSFTITVTTTPAANPYCLDFYIVNRN
jgi:hypothetical protein